MPRREKFFCYIPAAIVLTISHVTSLDDQIIQSHVKSTRRDRPFGECTRQKHSPEPGCSRRLSRGEVSPAKSSVGYWYHWKRTSFSKYCPPYNVAQKGQNRRLLFALAIAHAFAFTFAFAFEFEFVFAFAFAFAFAFPFDLPCFALLCFASPPLPTTLGVADLQKPYQKYRFSYTSQAPS